MENKPIVMKANETLVEAFKCEYTLVATEDEADEVFDYARLRQFFGAMQIPKMPDPLPPYLDRLEEEGYQFRLSWSGDPSLFVRKVRKQMVHFCPSLEDMEPAGDAAGTMALMPSGKAEGTVAKIPAGKAEGTMALMPSGKAEGTVAREGMVAEKEWVDSLLEGDNDEDEDDDDDFYT